MGEARVAVIPARRGSERLPRKNVRELLGRPLLAYTVEAALQSELFERVLVSTDDPEIGEIAVASGAEVPFLRAPALAGDHVPVSLVTTDALARVDPAASRFTDVAQLMPNCPLRTADDVRRSFEGFRASGAEAQLSVARFGWQNPWWAMRLGPGGVLEPVFPDHATARSQDLAELVCPTGAIWWAKADALRREHTFHLPGRRGWEIPPPRGLDIDTEEDWELAVLLLMTAPAAGARHE
jgi:CMP-N-acetylneuraminic acid synthetase